MAGRLVHYEIRAGDWDRAKRFWGSLFDWKFTESGGPIDYTMVDTGGDPGGAIYPTETSDRGIVVYFGVDDIDAALGQVRSLGGAVLGEKQPIPGVGWMARCRDTEGNDFSLFQSDESVAPAA
jgi:predicted enzyme related to lactoylglutathione lyase